MLLHWARQAAAASLGTRLHWSISHFNCDGWNNDHQVHTDLLRCSSCSLLANVHGSGAVGSFTILLVGWEASLGPCSTEMRPLVVADHSQASALLVCTVYTHIVQSYLGRISGSYVSVWTHGIRYWLHGVPPGACEVW